MGKGTLTVGPYHSDRSLLMPVAVGGLLTTLIAFLDVKTGMLNHKYSIESTIHHMNKTGLLFSYVHNTLIYSHSFGKL